MVNEGAAEGLPAAEPAATTTRRPTGTHAESVTECPASSRDHSPAGRDGPSRDRDGPFRVLVPEPATGSRNGGETETPPYFSPLFCWMSKPSLSSTRTAPLLPPSKSPGARRFPVANS